MSCSACAQRRKQQQVKRNATQKDNRSTAAKKAEPLRAKVRFTGRQSMDRGVIERLPSSFLDSAKDFLASSIEKEQKVYRESTEYFLTSTDEAARSSALESKGRIAAYQKIYKQLTGESYGS